MRLHDARLPSLRDPMPVHKSRSRGLGRFASTLIGVLALLACGYGAAESTNVWPDGLIGWMCGPNDAPVPMITSTTKEGASIRLIGPDAAVGTGSTFIRADLGKDSVYLCDSKGCELGTEGYFKVRAIDSGAWRVDFTAGFVQGRRPRVVYGSFVAHKSDAGTSMPCG
ncbi:hypothetical protein [Paraburkholderia antibiotica]|uniref:Uncharacterized protein n=1 Tax=Paraburkholderia antibiotica TaxID=2728839 RepID=A0A7X9X6K4_9BURK|nr:hypothetical protein [Paraburkholderia antibiotica]NML32340.1 hypothetical protein [Paraburkholderia antibiotica]